MENLEQVRYETSCGMAEKELPIPPQGLEWQETDRKFVGSCQCGQGCCVQDFVRYVQVPNANFNANSLISTPIL